MALLTIVGAVPPAFLGALHGIVVQGELDLAAVLLSNQAVEAAHMMLGEVLDWRISHQTHQVELT